MPWENVQRPESLYRYCRFDGEWRDRVLELLRTSTMYLPSRTKFNDPFDSRLDFDYTATPDEIREWLLKGLREDRPDMSEAEAQARSAMAVLDPNHNRPEQQRKFEQDMQQFVNEIGICCLSAKPDDTLMWSHYAGSHKGVCLEFRASVEDGELFGGALPIEYVERHPAIYLYTDPDDLIVRKALLTKSVRWSYEAEWRAIVQGYGGRVHPFKPEALLRVIVGAQMDVEAEGVLRAAVASVGQAPRLAKARLVPREYQIAIDDER